MASSAARASERDGPPEIRRLAAELNKTTTKLAALLTSQEQFVADASHELRTPLTALRLRLENGETSAALVEAERLARLVDELLALARADGAAGAAEDVPLGDVVEPADRAVGAARGRAGCATCGGRRRRAWCTPDGPGSSEVLDNLLSNAIDASAGGRPSRSPARAPSCT